MSGCIGDAVGDGESHRVEVEATNRSSRRCVTVLPDGEPVEPLVRGHIQAAVGRVWHEFVNMLHGGGLVIRWRMLTGVAQPARSDAVLRPMQIVRLEEALAVTGHSDTDVTYRLLRTPEEAAEVPFAGSPTITLDGEDLFATDGRTTDLACRIYFTPAGIAGLPTTEQLVEAITSHAPEPTVTCSLLWQGYAAEPGSTLCDGGAGSSADVVGCG